jgi:hypothetical protein
MLVLVVVVVVVVMFCRDTLSNRLHSLSLCSVHLWRTLSAGAAFSKPNTPTDFFVKPIKCDGSDLDASTLDLSAFEVSIVGPSGGELPAEFADALTPIVAGEDDGFVVLDDGSLRVRYQVIIVIVVCRRDDVNNTQY